MQTLTLSQAKPEPDPERLLLPPSLARLQQQHQPEFCAAGACGCSLLAPPRPELQGLGLLAELSSFCPVPRGVDFEFPVGGTGGCFSLPWRRCWWKPSVHHCHKCSSLQSLGTCKRRLLAHPFSNHELFNALGAPTEGGSGWAQTHQQNVLNKCKLGFYNKRWCNHCIGHQCFMTEYWGLITVHSSWDISWLQAVSLWKLGTIRQQSWTLRNDANL